MIKELKKLNDAITTLRINECPNELIKDVLFQLFIMNTEFDSTYTNNKVVICEQSDLYTKPSDYPEIEEIIDDCYLKQLFIISDTGEGVVVYTKIK